VAVSGKKSLYDTLKETKIRGELGEGIRWEGREEDQGKRFNG